MNAHAPASENSASAASATPSHISLPLCEVTTSNHASQTSIVAVTAASGTSHWEPPNAAHAAAADAAGAEERRAGGGGERRGRRDVEAGPGDVVVRRDVRRGEHEGQVQRPR